MLKYIILLFFVIVGCSKTDLSKNSTTISNVNTFQCPPPIAAGNACFVKVSHILMNDVGINLTLTSDDIVIVGLSYSF